MNAHPGPTVAPEPAWRPLVVVAAHPDDETVGAGGLLATAQSAVVVPLTDGVPRDRRFWADGISGQPDDYARIRRAELAAALDRARLVAPVVAPLEARDQEAIERAAPLARALAAVLRRYRPALVVTHPYEGGHPDHDAAALVAFAAVALLRREGGSPPRLVEMTSYHADGAGIATGRFLPPSTPEVERCLAPDVRERKQRMLAAYASQREVLALFRADVERFRRAPRYDFTAAPHAGVLLYERWGFPVNGARWRAAARAALRELGLGAS